MPIDDRKCGFCGRQIPWSESSSIDDGQEFHVAPHKCWIQYLDAKNRKERDTFENRHELDNV
jgi:hypothetical protein